VSLLEDLTADAVVPDDDADWMIYLGEQGGAAVLIRVQHGDSDEGLARLQALVGGYIEVARGDGALFIVDEEGLLKGRSKNVLASKLLGRTIVGPAVVCSEDGVHFGSVTDSMLQRVSDAATIVLHGDYVSAR